MILKLGFHLTWLIFFSNPQSKEMDKKNISVFSQS